MTLNRYISGLLAGGVLSACASNNFKVLSTPAQSEVFLEVASSGEKKSLGQTPLEIPISQLSEMVGPETANGEFLTIVVEKQGFVPQRLALPHSQFGTLVTQLDVKLKEGDSSKQITMAEEILNRFFLAQKFTLNKEYVRAQSEIDKILSVAPNFARAYSMRASIYFVQGNLPESLKWYESALKQDPQMEDAIKMIARINGRLGTQRLPAMATPRPGASQ